MRSGRGCVVVGLLFGAFVSGACTGKNDGGTSEDDGGEPATGGTSGAVSTGGSGGSSAGTSSGGAMPSGGTASGGTASGGTAGDGSADCVKDGTGPATGDCVAFCESSHACPGAAPIDCNMQCD